MEPNEFIKKVNELDVSYYRKGTPTKSWEPSEFVFQYRHSSDGVENPPTLKDFLYIEWSIGGQTGGSCWDEGDATYHPREAEPEPNFNCLDIILEAFCPSLSYIKYKLLVADIVKEDTQTSNEYYGNYTTYAIKYVCLGDLYAKLKEISLI
jgi:hypothetical protein